MGCQGEEGGKECTESEMQDLQAEYSQCAVQMEYQFEERKDDSDDITDDESGGCILVSRTVLECGNAWQKCYTEEEVQRMQDMQVESLLAQHRTLPLSRCSIVSEYLESGRREENRMEEDSLCTDMKSVRGQQAFQTCSHTESTRAYDRILDMGDGEEVRSVLCSTLKRIGSVCPRELEECFSREDLARTTKNHLKEMRKFLLSFAQGKISEDALNGCGAEQIEEVGSGLEETESEVNSRENTDESESEIISSQPTVVQTVAEHSKPQMGEKSAVLTKAEHNKFEGHNGSATIAHLSILHVFLFIFEIYIA